MAMPFSSSSAKTARKGMDFFPRTMCMSLMSAVTIQRNFSAVGISSFTILWWMDSLRMSSVTGFRKVLWGGMSQAWVWGGGCGLHSWWLAA